ncbi:MAG TPA: hypothetical protein PKW95_17975 [bacterium]|nr:hypothetical protein [bacterium]
MPPINVFHLLIVVIAYAVLLCSSGRLVNGVLRRISASDELVVDKKVATPEW